MSTKGVALSFCPQIVSSYPRGYICVPTPMPNGSHAG
jgi:hypothetical protein